VRRLDCPGNADQTLGLKWRNVNFEWNESQFRRVQENKGKHFDATKTEAGMGTIPMRPTLREMFLNWREK